MSKKLLIIGAGISGATLAHCAQKAGIETTIVDSNALVTASKVAAGVINPLSMSRKKVIWRGEEFANEAWRFYHSIDNGFIAKERMFFECKSQKELNDWEASNASERGFLKYKRHNLLEGFEIVNSGWIDSKKYLRTLDSINIEQQESNIDLPQDIPNLIQKYDWVILATGFDGIGNFQRDYRTDLFKPVLGDVLTVRISNVHQFMHYEGIFVIPLAEKGLFKLGSTYIHGYSSSEPQEKNKQLLLQKAKEQNIYIIDVVKHETAIRPASFDRFPLIGLMKGQQNLYLFSGMGSRCLLYAPLMAKQLVDLIQNGTPVWKEVNVERAVSVTRA